MTGISGATEYYISDGTARGAMEGHGWTIFNESNGPISTAIGVLGNYTYNLYYHIYNTIPYRLCIYHLPYHSIDHMHVSCILVIGMPGATAWVALRDYVSFPKGGTVVVSAAAGAVGNLFGQLAKRAGAGKVIGLAGTREKCAALLTRGFDVAINYKVYHHDYAQYTNIMIHQ